jgi:hypothetical protein
MAPLYFTFKLTIGTYIDFPDVSRCKRAKKGGADPLQEKILDKTLSSSVK